MMRRRIVLHCPDIALKGRNRPDFEQAQVRSVRAVLAGLGVVARVGVTRGRLHVEATDLPEPVRAATVAALACVPGISAVGDAQWLSPGALGIPGGGLDWDLLEAAVLALAGEVHGPGLTFAIDARRVDRALPVGSVALERRLGAAVLAGHTWRGVDLVHPDVRLHVDAYPDGVYVYGRKVQGVGGLPVGTLGHVVALLSGGIDSPVAAFQLARRGCSIDALHVSAGTLGDFDPVGAQVARLAAQLSRFTQRTRLLVLPDIGFDLALRGPRVAGYEAILFRRFLLRAATRLASRVHAGAIVMGDSLGQVASQTLENINALADASAMTVFRPLIGMNKPEIIDVARRLGTYDISIEPHRDCCTLLARRPRTRLGAARVVALESSLFPDYDALLAEVFGQGWWLEFEHGRLTRSARGTLRFPTGA